MKPTATQKSGIFFWSDAIEILQPSKQGYLTKYSSINRFLRVCFSEQNEYADDDQELNDNLSEYSESVATIRSDIDDDATTTSLETGSEWGDQFAPWELHVKSNEFTVRDLVTMKKEYQFRVIAVNEVGRSEPSLPSDLIQPRPDQKRPSTPRALRNVGTTPTSISLQWEEPEDSGGADILGYALQLKAGRSKQWKEVAVDIKDLTYNVADLTEGQSIFPQSKLTPYRHGLCLSRSLLQHRRLVRLA